MAKLIGPTTPEGQAVEAFFTEAQKMLSYLYSRWQDEKEYENIEEYAKPLTATAEKHGLKIVKMNKRPFGCDLSINNMTYRVDVKSTSMGWGRVRP